MIYWYLFLTFFKVSCLSVGGAYSAIPLIREDVMSMGWVSEAELLDLIALSESTPGPIMINLATYVGTVQAGLLGALVATLGIVAPAFGLFIAIAKLGRTLFKKPLIEGILNGLKPVLMGVILATGVEMLIEVLLGTEYKPEWQAIAIAAVLVAAMFGYQKGFKRSLSPIKCILIAAALGVCLY